MPPNLRVAQRVVQASADEVGPLPKGELGDAMLGRVALAEGPPRAQADAPDGVLRRREVDEGVGQVRVVPAAAWHVDRVVGPQAPLLEHPADAGLVQVVGDSLQDDGGAALLRRRRLAGGEPRRRAARGAALCLVVEALLFKDLPGGLQAPRGRAPHRLPSLQVREVARAPGVVGEDLPRELHAPRRSPVAAQVRGGDPAAVLRAPCAAPVERVRCGALRHSVRATPDAPARQTAAGPGSKSRCMAGPKMAGPVAA
mmetsp:Transcript_23822/g.67819  ORF Transcript_23822/g.67819 Transcript_23822/m.67819 type:complete len:256 (+) Transcript_23822:494-1261(+)